MKRIIFLSFLLLSFVGYSLQGQGRVIKGKVISEEDGVALPGVSVVVPGTTIGAVTNFDGEYSITVPDDAIKLMFSFVGMLTQEVEIGDQTVINVELESTSTELDEVVVTALGISREKKSLGYAVQEVGGDEISTAVENNFSASLSGKVAGVQIKAPNTMGGSANVLIRGTTSLTGNNQPLYVIDGVPVDNSNLSENADGWGGYDYGNQAMDLNPADIESVSVLKGAAASALYGNRAANGVILVTTKKASGRKGVGVSVNSNFQVGSVDNSTLPLHQYEYGAGYGPYYEDATGHFFEGDVDGDGNPDLIVPTSEDASWGHPFDPSLMVVHWDALDPAADNYGEKRPWVAPPEGHRMPSFFETSQRWMNNIAFEGANKNGKFRLSYTNLDEKGILPNSSIKKNNVNLSGTYNLSDRLTVSGNVNYISQNTVGRYGTGYDAGNPMQSFGQWFQTNVDFERLKNYKSPYDGHQYTWNYAYWTPDSHRPIYFDNPYWVRYKNFQDDQRNRVLGYATADYDFTDWLTLSLRTSIDYYQDIQNERIAVGSNAQSDFTNFNRNFRESNTDLLLKFNRNVADLSFNGFVGANYRMQTIQSIQVSTVGGLLIPDFYTVTNSASPVAPSENLIELTERSVFANLSVGYQDLIYLEGTGRVDQSSSLRPGETSDYTFFYPSIAASFLLHELGSLEDVGWLDYAKLRANYANVGSGTGAYRKVNTYDQYANWGRLGMFSQPATLQNPDLVPENTKSIEVGFEGFFADRRLGIDLALYQTNTFNQILPVPVSNASGYNRIYVNGGEIENRGIEVALYTTPVRTNDFSWNLNLNWYANRNTVISLAEGVPTLQLMSAWDVKINAEAGEPYGTIKGIDYVYTDGKPTVGDDGYLLLGDDPLAVIGNIQPDWNAGITNVLTYKNVTLSALIDIQMGGDIYSVNSKYGLATGVYAETAGLNDKGNPKRDPVADGGGMRFEDAVKQDGSPNDIYIPASRWGGYWYYGWSPTARYLYDASYVKLRELSLSYSLPRDILEESFIRGVDVAIVGRNLWIIHKNAPTFDPEAILTSGNLQGIEQGAYPAIRTLGVNLKLNF